MAIGKAGATNAAVLAVQILAESDETLRQRLVEHKQQLAEKVEARSRDAEKRAAQLVSGAK
jgi:5-(carboxyamino)imidazole ribonucleotide mutase